MFYHINLPQLFLKQNKTNTHTKDQINWKVTQTIFAGMEYGWYTQ